MSTLTKEWLLKTIAELEEERDAVPGVVNGDADKALAAMKIALASLETESVVYVMADDLKDSSIISTPAYRDLGEAMERTVGDVVALYAAPPAPVSVPDYPEILPCPVMLEPGLRFGKGVNTRTMLGALQRRAGHCAELEAMTPEQRAEHEAGMKEFAAMLQGAEHVTTANRLPFEQWLSQQTGTIDVECGCVMTEVFFHWLRVAYEAGNSPHCREILNSSTNNCRESAETSTKCWCHTCRPVTISDMRFVVCPECGNKRCPHANDHRNACTGSNEPGQEGSAYPAAPQQEISHAIAKGMERYGDAMQELAKKEAK